MPLARSAWISAKNAARRAGSSTIGRDVAELAVDLRERRAAEPPLAVRRDRSRSERVSPRSQTQQRRQRAARIRAPARTP